MAKNRLAIPIGESKGLDSIVFEHFGRAPYFIFVDIENGKVTDFWVEENPAVEHAPGLIPKYLKDKGVDVVIVRGIGFRAVKNFEAYGIAVIRGAEGRVKDILERFLRGELADKPYTPKSRFHERE